MTESKPDQGAEPTSPPPASTPDELVKDLDVSADEADAVTGGRKAGKGQQEFLVVKMDQVFTT